MTDGSSLVDPNLPPRPRLALRVGITGARNVEDAQRANVQYELERVIKAIKRHVDLLAQTLKDCYTSNPLAGLVLLSPLAEGADRLAAATALEAGYAVQVITPFALAEYELDFKTAASVEQFHELLAKASGGCIELDGARNAPEEAAAYEAAGELIVRNCDLLIALWDGEEGRGRGGTEAIVRYAMSIGVPIWWINLKRPQGARLITGTRHLIEPKVDDSADAALGAYLRRLLEPPQPGDEQPATLLEHLRKLAQRLRPAPIQVYFASKPRAARRIWRAHDWLIRFAAGFPPSSVPDEPLEDTYWYRMFAPADRRANDYGRRVRSAYVLVSLLTAASVGLAACAPIFAAMSDTSEVATTTIELLCLLAISAMLLGRQWHEWQRRWRDYRRLAEYFRAQQALAPMCEAQPGWIRAVANIDFPPPIGRDLWVAWLVAAASRGAPLRSQRFGGASLEEQRGRILDLVEQQNRYHATASLQARLAERRFRQLDELSFPVVVAVVAFKLLTKLYHWEAPGEWLNLAAIVLPVLALNVASIRAATRLQLQADRSKAMADHMSRAAVRLRAVDLSLPLASRDLATIAQSIASVMQQDTEGRFEVIEPD